MDVKIVGAKPSTPREAATLLIKTFMPRYLPWGIVIGKTPAGAEVKHINTACNIMFTDVVQLLGLDGPYHWVDKEGNPLKWIERNTVVKGNELSANELVDWFHTHGNAYGYMSMSRNEAEKLAETGALVAVTYKNPNLGHSGHIGCMLENGTLAQAGAGIPFVGHPIEEGFGNLPTEFWGYVETGRD
jgi:hypothetical protein